MLAFHTGPKNDPYGLVEYYVEFTDGTWLEVSASGGAYCTATCDVTLEREASHREYRDPHNKQWSKHKSRAWRDSETATRLVWDKRKPWIRYDD